MTERFSRAPGCAFGCAALALVGGLVTSVGGFVLSLSLGMISLAIATLLVRPLAVTFVAIHAATLLAAAIGLRRARTREDRLASVLALALSALGLAGSIAWAVWGPGFFETLLGGAADAASAVH